MDLPFSSPPPPPLPPHITYGCTGHWALSRAQLREARKKVGVTVVPLWGKGSTAAITNHYTPQSAVEQLAEMNRTRAEKSSGAQAASSSQPVSCATRSHAITLSSGDTTATPPAPCRGRPLSNAKADSQNVADAPPASEPSKPKRGRLKKTKAADVLPTTAEPTSPMRAGATSPAVNPSGPDARPDSPAEPAKEPAPAPPCRPTPRFKGAAPSGDTTPEDTRQWIVPPQWRREALAKEAALSIPPPPPHRPTLPTLFTSVSNAIQALPDSVPIGLPGNPLSPITSIERFFEDQGIDAGSKTDRARIPEAFTSLLQFIIPANLTPEELSALMYRGDHGVNGVYNLLKALFQDYAVPESILNPCLTSLLDACGELITTASMATHSTNNPSSDRDGSRSLLQPVPDHPNEPLFMPSPSPPPPPWSTSPLEDNPTHNPADDHASNSGGDEFTGDASEREPVSGVVRNARDDIDAENGEGQVEDGEEEEENEEDEDDEDEYELDYTPKRGRYTQRELAELKAMGAAHAKEILNWARLNLRLSSSATQQIWGKGLKFTRSLSAWNAYLMLNPGQSVIHHCEFEEKLSLFPTKALASQWEKDLIAQAKQSRNKVNKLVADHGAVQAKVIQAEAKKLESLGEQLSSLGITFFYGIFSRQTQNDSAMRHNSISFNDSALEKYFESSIILRDRKKWVGEAYAAIVGCHCGPAMAAEVVELQDKEQRSTDLLKKDNAQKAVSRDLCSWFNQALGMKEPPVSQVQWVKLPKWLAQNRLLIKGAPLESEFPLLGSFSSSDIKSAEPWRAFASILHNHPPQEYPFSVEKFTWSSDPDKGSSNVKEYDRLEDIPIITSCENKPMLYYGDEPDRHVEKILGKRGKGSDELTSDGSKRKRKRVKMGATLSDISDDDSNSNSRDQESMTPPPRRTRSPDHDTEQQSNSRTRSPEHHQAPRTKNRHSARARVGRSGDPPRHRDIRETEVGAQVRHVSDTRSLPMQHQRSINLDFGGPSHETHDNSRSLSRATPQSLQSSPHPQRSLPAPRHSPTSFDRLEGSSSSTLPHPRSAVWDRQPCLQNSATGRLGDTHMSSSPDQLDFGPVPDLFSQNGGFPASSQFHNMVAPQHTVSNRPFDSSQFQFSPLSASPSWPSSAQ